MPRIRPFDHARGFTVLLIPAVHVFMLYGDGESRRSVAGLICQLLAEETGACLLMVLMGACLPTTRKLTSSKVWRRAIGLLLAGYALNFYKFILPASFQLLPEDLLKELPATTIAQLLIGDIFHLAGLSYIILYYIYQCPYYKLVAFLLGSLILFIAPFSWELPATGITFLDHVTQLLTGRPPQTYFPIFPWLAYPLMGLAFHIQLAKGSGFVYGLLLLILSLLMPASPVISEYPSFYRSYPADTLFHIGIAILWISLWNKLSVRFPSNHFFNLLQFASRHIRIIYFIQWILICWLVKVAGFGSNSLVNVLVWSTAITLLSFVITKLIVDAHNKNLRSDRDRDRSLQSGTGCTLR